MTCSSCSDMYCQAIGKHNRFGKTELMRNISASSDHYASHVELLRTLNVILKFYRLVDLVKGNFQSSDILVRQSGLIRNILKQRTLELEEREIKNGSRPVFSKGEGFQNMVVSTISSIRIIRQFLHSNRLQIYSFASFSKQGVLITYYSYLLLHHKGLQWVNIKVDRSNGPT